MGIPTIYPQYICCIAELKFERFDYSPAVHLQVKTPCKGTATVTNINTNKGVKNNNDKARWPDRDGNMVRPRGKSGSRYWNVSDDGFVTH